MLNIYKFSFSQLISNNMALPAAALIAGGAALVGTGANAAATANLNKKTRAYNREMYDVQKRDNIDFWNMQNSYNSPQAQMARFQEAGLNPNLIYGQGNSGNSGQISTPHMEGYSPARPNLDPSPAVEGYFSTQAKQISIDNMKKQGDILEAQKRALDADVISKLFSNDLNLDTREFLLDKRRYEANKLVTGHDLQMQAYGQNELLNPLKLALSKATLQAITKDNVMRDSKTNLLNQSFQINDIRRRLQKDQYDSSLKGMQLQDWLKLILGGVSQLRK